MAVWALVAASVVFWGLRLLSRSPAVPPSAIAVGDVAALRGDLTRLFGAPPVQVAAAAPAVAETNSRFRLLGIMAPPRRSSDRGGVALIAVDGKPPRAYAVGTPLDESLVLQSVSLREASIGPANGPAAVTLRMAPLPSAATGVLPPAGGAPVPAVRYVPSYLPQPAPPVLPAPPPPPPLGGGQAP